MDHKRRIQENINLAFWNVRGIRNLHNIASQELEMHMSNTVVLGLSETWITAATVFLPTALKHMKNIHHPATKDKSTGRPSGGLGILYDPKYVTDVEIIDSSEIYIAIKTKICGTNAIIVSVYMRSIHYKTRLEALKEILGQITLRYEHHLIMVGGDFNGRLGRLNQLDELLISGTKIKRLSVHGKPWCQIYQK